MKPLPQELASLPNTRTERARMEGPYGYDYFLWQRLSPAEATRMLDEGHVFFSPPLPRPAAVRKIMESQERQVAKFDAYYNQWIDLRESNGPSFQLVTI